jgi:hypothetical protein
VSLDYLARRFERRLDNAGRGRAVVAVGERYEELVLAMDGESNWMNAVWVKRLLSYRQFVSKSHHTMFAYV